MLGILKKIKLNFKQPSVQEEVILHEEPSVQEEVILHEEPSVQEEVILHEDLSVQEEVILHEEPSVQEEVILHEEPSVQEEVILHEEPSVQEDNLSYIERQQFFGDKKSKWNYELQKRAFLVLNYEYKFIDLLSRVNKYNIFYNVLQACDYDSVELEKIKKFDTFNDIFNEVYQLTYSCKTLTEFDELINNEYKIYLIKKYYNSDKIVDSITSLQNHFYKLTTEYSEKHQKSFSMHEDDDMDISYLLNNCDFKSYNDSGTIVSFSYILSGLVQIPISCVRLLCLEKYTDKIFECNEFSMLCISMFMEQAFTEKEEMDKLFDMYVNLYSNMFNDVLNKEDFNQLLRIHKNRVTTHHSNDNSQFSQLLKNHLTTFHNAVIKFMNNTKTSKNPNGVLLSYTNLNKFLEVFIKNLQIEIQDLNTFDNKKDWLARKIIDATINYFTFGGDRALKCETHLEFIYNYFTLCDRVEQRIDKLILEAEKNRYLNGDYSLEYKQKKNLLSFESVTDGYSFERYLEQLFIEEGYTVKLTKKSGDQGADLLVQKSGILTAVQAKFYTGNVGNKAVQEIIGALKFYGAQQGIVITNSKFTSSAIELAEANEIKLINGDMLNVWIENLSSKYSYSEMNITNNLDYQPADYSVMLEMNDNMVYSKISNNPNYLEKLHFLIQLNKEKLLTQKTVLINTLSLSLEEVEEILYELSTNKIKVIDDNYRSNFNFDINDIFYDSSIVVCNIIESCIDSRMNIDDITYSLNEMKMDKSNYDIALAILIDYGILTDVQREQIMEMPYYQQNYCSNEHVENIYSTESEVEETLGYNDESFNEEEFLSNIYSVGVCLYKNPITEEYDSVNLNLSRGHLILESLEDISYGEVSEKLIYPVSSEFICDVENTDLSLVTIGDDSLAVNKDQYKLIELYIQLLNTL